MLCDAHVHMGYYSRKGRREPFYYSPRRILGVLDRCGIGKFIVSSTCAQIAGIGVDAIVREAREMKRIAGSRAQIFFWLSGHLYDEDPGLSWIGNGLFAGIKFHEIETPWMERRSGELRRVLSVAAERNLPVMFHSGPNLGCRPLELAKIACAYPSVRFNFAHCRPMDEMAKVVADCPNVWTDTAYMALGDFQKLRDYDWHGRLMFGSDLPTWQTCGTVGLTAQYRAYVMALRETGLIGAAADAFAGFLIEGRQHGDGWSTKGRSLYIHYVHRQVVATF